MPNVMVSCGNGTVADAGLCVPDLTALCGAGTVAFDGRCLTPVEVLREGDPVVESEPNDPFNTGVPNEVTLPDVEGEEVLLTGEISAPDSTGAEDWDAFSFTTTSPLEVLYIEIIPAGLPKPLYLVFGDLLEVGDGEFFRQSPQNTGSFAREIIFPNPGEYVLFVADADNAGGSGGVGGEGMEYFVRITRRPSLDLTTASPVNVQQAGYSVPAEELATSSDKIQNIVPANGGTLVTFERTAYDAAFSFQHLLLFAADGTFLGEEGFTECFTDSFFGTQCYLRPAFRRILPDEGIYTILDYSSSSGAAVVGTEVSISAPENLPPERTATLANGGEEDFIVTVPAGFLLSVEVAGGADVSPVIEFVEAESNTTLDRTSGTAGTTARLNWYFEEETSVVVIVGDGTEETTEGSDYSYTLTADTIPVTLMDAIDPANSAITSTVTSGALNATGKDVTWLAVPLTLDSVGELEVTVEDSAAEIGFTIYTQTSTGLDEVAVAFPESGVATYKALGKESGLLLLELVAIEGVSTGAAVTVNYGEITTYTGEGNTCDDGPVAITEPGVFVFQLSDYSNDFSASGIYGTCGESTTTRGGKSGPDALFTFTVPAGQAVTISTDGGGQGDDTVITILENQADLCTTINTDGGSDTFTCAAYDDDSGDGYFSVSTWENSGTDPVEIFVIIDNYSVLDPLGAEDTNVVTVSLSAIENP